MRESCSEQKEQANSLSIHFPHFYHLIVSLLVHPLPMQPIALQHMATICFLHYSLNKTQKAEKNNDVTSQFQLCSKQRCHKRSLRCIFFFTTQDESQCFVYVSAVAVSFLTTVVFSPFIASLHFLQPPTFHLRCPWLSRRLSITSKGTVCGAADNTPYPQAPASFSRAPTQSLD